MCCDAMRRTTGITQFIFLNCHGGNRPTLEQVCDELYFSPLGTEAILVNPVSLVAAQFSNNPIPDVHAGLLETSLLLAIAPDQVDMTALRELDFSILNAGRVRDRIARRGVYWPWSSEDPTLAVHGIIGDPRQATAELGREIIIAAQEAPPTTDGRLRIGAENGASWAGHPMDRLRTNDSRVLDACTAALNEGRSYCRAHQPLVHVRSSG